MSSSEESNDQPPIRHSVTRRMHKDTSVGLFGPLPPATHKGRKDTRSPPPVRGQLHRSVLDPGSRSLTRSSSLSRSNSRTSPLSRASPTSRPSPRTSYSSKESIDWQDDGQQATYLRHQRRIDLAELRAGARSPSGTSEPDTDEEFLSPRRDPEPTAVSSPSTVKKGPGRPRLKTSQLDADILGDGAEPSPPK